MWNDRIAAAVHDSKVAHLQWKKAGKPNDRGCGVSKRRRESAQGSAEGSALHTELTATGPA